MHASLPWKGKVIGYEAESQIYLSGIAHTLETTLDFVHQRIEP